MNVKLTAADKLQGSPQVPGDKSISHRALLFGALAEGTTEVSHLLESGDVQSTGRCLKSMGIEIWQEAGKTFVKGKGLRGLKAPTAALDCGNSGTTIRHLMGILAGQTFSCTLTGDESLSRRPMKRIAKPLTEMGARFELTGGETAPIHMTGVGKLKALDYDLPVASAQLKSALILAGLYAEGTTRLRGLIQSRDHTERLLPHFGVAIKASSEEISILGGQSLRAAKVNVPGDPSTAAFWIGAATLVPGSQVELKNISLNPTRTGFIKALKRMGAEIESELVEKDPEPIGNLRIKAANLRGTKIEPHEVPEMIDEIPLLAVLAMAAQGVTEVRGAEELRVKESDRIEAVAKNLRAMGGVIETFHDGFRIMGPQKLQGARIDSCDDHRIAMAFSIASLIAEGETEIVGAECVGISYPAFFETLRKLTRGT